MDKSCTDKWQLDNCKYYFCELSLYAKFRTCTLKSFHKILVEEVVVVVLLVVVTGVKQSQLLDFKSWVLV